MRRSVEVRWQKRFSLTNLLRRRRRCAPPKTDRITIGQSIEAHFSPKVNTARPFNDYASGHQWNSNDGTSSGAIFPAWCVCPEPPTRVELNQGGNPPPHAKTCKQTSQLAGRADTRIRNSTEADETTCSGCSALVATYHICWSAGHRLE